MRSTGCPCGWRGRPGQCAAFRPGGCDTSRRSAHSARARRSGRGAGGRGSGIRRGPQAAGHRGCRARQPPRRRACVRRTRRKLPPRDGETPRLNPGRLRWVTLAALPSRLLAPVPAVHGRGRQAWRAEGAPLMIVKKILTASTWRTRGCPSATQGSRIVPRWYGWCGRRRCPTRRRRREQCQGRDAGPDRSFPGSRDRRCLESLSARRGLG